MVLQEKPQTAAAVLTDGTRMSELIDTEYREVAMRVLDDEELYRLELKHIFARAWTAVAHEDEIPDVGDYVLRYVGEDELIISRGENGDITAALNVCSHRGVKVCRFEAGNAKTLQCPYHGWVYKSDGSFLAAPMAKEVMQGTLRSKAELSLLRARTDTYLGMVFATFDESAPSLREYLGPIAWYCDLMFGRTDSGMTILGHPQRFTIKANWKSAAEQLAGDVLHTGFLHRSMIELGIVTMNDDMPDHMLGMSASFQGHFSRCFDLRKGHYISAQSGKDVTNLSAMERLRLIPPPGMSVDMVDQLESRFNEGQLRVLAEWTPQECVIFPNVVGLAMPFQMADGSASAFFSWRSLVPKGPHEFEIVHWTMVERDATRELRDSVNMMTTTTFGAGGFIEADDSDAWPQQAKCARGVMGAQRKLRYQAITGESRPDDWPGPGQIYAGVAKDDAQWNWWLRYLEFMEGRPW